MPSRSRISSSVVAVVLALASSTDARADAPVPDAPAPTPTPAPAPAPSTEARSGFAVMLGLGQWALGGGNVAVQWNIGHLALEYSHGQGVHLSELGLLRNQSEKDAGADVHETWTSGFGLGLLAFHNLRILLEFKGNHYELEGGNRNSRLSYTTFTIGPGVFYDVTCGRGSSSNLRSDGGRPCTRRCRLTRRCPGRTGRR